MKSSPLKVSSLVLILILGLASGFRIISSKAQTSKQNETTQPWKIIKTGPRNLKVKPQRTDPELLSSRVIEDQIPAHLPLKVELQNLDAEKLLDNVTLKVTNLSKKPIYFLDFEIILPDVRSPQGDPIGFPLRYGRIDLLQFDKPLRREDVPLQPGESYLFKIDNRSLEGFKQYSARISLTQSEIKRVYLFFYLLNFGDGTGFSTPGGDPIDIKKEPPNSSCQEEKSKSAINPVRLKLPSLLSASFQPSLNFCECHENGFELP